MLLILSPCVLHSQFAVYDAYMVELCEREKTHLYTLDEKLRAVAESRGVRLLEAWTMSVYTYTSARQNLARVLDEASGHVDVHIKRKNGQLFKVVAVSSEVSGLDVPGVDTDIGTDKLIDIIRHAREVRA